MLRYSRPLRRLGRNGTPSKFYYCRAYCTESKRRQWVNTGCSSMRTAEEWRRERELDQARGPEARRARAAEGMTFDQAYHAWLLAKEASISAVYFDSLKRRGDRLWLHCFGGRRLADITPHDVRQYLAGRRKGTLRGRRGKPVGARAVNDDLVALRELFRFAEHEGWLARSPAVTVKRHAGERKRARTFWLDPSDEERLLRCAREAAPPVEVKARRNAAGRHAGGARTKPKAFTQPVPAPPDYLAPLITIALYAGFRRRTLVELEWQHADLERARWRIPPELQKTSRAYHEPMARRVVDELRAYRRQLQSQAQTVQQARERLAPKARIFGLQKPESFRRAWRSVVRRAGLDLRIHDCRRIFLGKLREDGVAMETAMKLSGHESIEIVLECYRSARDTDVEKAIRSLGQVGAERTDQEEAAAENE